VSPRGASGVDRAAGARGAVAALAAAFVAVGCGGDFVAVRPSEPLAARAGELEVEVARVFLSSDARTRGLADDDDLVVELRVRNAGSSPRRIPLGSFSCFLEVDARRPGQTRALLAGGGGEGPFPGRAPEEGSLLATSTLPPGETRVLWALFHGYRFEGSDVPRRVALRVPVEGGAPFDVTLADPSRGELRWEMPPVPAALSIGLRSGMTFASGLRLNITSTEIARLARAGRLLWDVGLVSSVVVQTDGPLASSTSAFTGTGLSAHLALPLLSWGPAQDPRQLGVFAGGAAQLLVELPSQRALDDMAPVHTYGL
jgi:hypothetical protein